MTHNLLVGFKRAKPITALCFTAQEANSSVQLNKIGELGMVEIETCTDGKTWTDYTFGNIITLDNVGDNVYFRTKSETDVFFSLHAADYYQFSMTGKIGASGDITSLKNKNGTTNPLSAYCFYSLFSGCTSLTTAPALPSTKLDVASYRGMFKGCTGLTNLPKLPVTRLIANCYIDMFNGCTNIKLSETQTGEYQTPYRIPTTGDGIDSSLCFTRMFENTGGTFTGEPAINTTYYTSNTLI